MRPSILMLLAALLGVLVGAWLIAPWAFGLAVIVDSVGVGVFALFVDDETSVERPVSGVTEEQRFIAAVVDDKRRSA